MNLSDETVEKFKKQKNGNIHRYCYYGCSKARDKNCRSGYINEKKLIEEFIQLIERMDLNETNLRQKLASEVERMKKFQKVLLKDKEAIQIGDVDIKSYAKYLLKEGSNMERRDVMGCFRSRLTLTKGCVTLS